MVQHCLEGEPCVLGREYLSARGIRDFCHEFGTRACHECCCRWRRWVDERLGVAMAHRPIVVQAWRRVLSPRAFIAQVVSPFVHRNTRAKIVVCRSTFLPSLGELVDVSNVPQVRRRFGANEKVVTRPVPTEVDCVSCRDVWPGRRVSGFHLDSRS